MRPKDPPAFRVAFHARLVEEAVLRAEPHLSPEDSRLFRWERDRLYEVADVDERECRFEELHGRWFVCLGLDRPLHAALGEQPSLLRRAAGCHAERVVSRNEETADLLCAPERPEQPGTIVVRLRPESLLEPERLRAFLRRELMHVADILEPRFGYERELPPCGGGPARDNLVRDRYRVVWDTTIEGRLRRRGLAEAHAREARLAEFGRVFPMPGPDLEAAFARWFDEPQPTHAAIVAFIRDPADGAEGARLAAR